MKKLLPFFFSVLFLSAFLFRTAPPSPVTYRGVVAQEAEADPYEAYVYQNDLGMTFAPVRSDVGQYALNASASIFPSNAKVYMQNSLYNEGTDITNLCLIKTRRWDANTIWVSTFRQDAETGFFVPTDGCSFYLEIVVYP